MSHPTLPNPEPEREPRHYADLRLHVTFCGVRRGEVLEADRPEDVTCPPCRDVLDNAPLAPLPAIDSWAATSYDELEQRLRDSSAHVDRVLGGFDAATPDAEILAMMLDPDYVHYDPGTLERLTLCDLNVGELEPVDYTTDPAQVTCPVCQRGLTESPLPPEPVDQPTDPYAFERVVAHYGPERFESAAPWLASCGYEFVGGVQDPSEVTHTWTSESANVDCPACRALIEGTAAGQSERRTVGLEVLTDELRRAAAWPDDKAVVGIVVRSVDEVLAVPEMDAEWRSPSRLPADVLAQMLRQARHYADDARAELLMPTPDVLAALAGQPLTAAFTVPVESSIGALRAGWLLRSEVEAEPGRHEVTWQLVDAVGGCELPGCPVAEDPIGHCCVVTVRGSDVQHVESWRPVSVRIPATTEVEA